MAGSYFIWNGVDSRSMGIHLTGVAPIVRPEERVKSIEIPGRPGDLTQTEGEDVYNTYIQTQEIHVRGRSRVREVLAWLRGAGYVTFSGEPDRRQEARIIGAITLDRVSPGLETWVGEVQFKCQPMKEKIWDKTVELLRNQVLMNTGDVVARPEWTVTPTAATMTLASGGKSITATGLTAGTPIIIDSEAQAIYNAGKTAEITKNGSGDFPVLAVGRNSVTGSGWTTANVMKRERWL